MTCRHPNRHRWAVLYADDGRVVSRIDCLLCGGVVPLGSANDTPQVELEMLAANVAAIVLDGYDAMDACRASTGAGYDSLICGWDDEAAPSWLGVTHPLMLDRCAAGALARQIYDGEVKR